MFGVGVGVGVWVGAALGWGLSLMVVVLAMVNLFAEFCAGCFVFYQLERLGLIGAPPKNS